MLVRVWIRNLKAKRLIFLSLIQRWNTEPVLWCPEQLNHLQRNQIPVSGPERWHRNYNHCYYHHSRCYHTPCLNGDSSRVKQGLASAFCFWFSNVKMWRAIRIYREAEAPVGKLERRERLLVLFLSVSKLELTQKWYSQNSAACNGTFAFPRESPLRKTNTEPRGWQPRANRHYNKAVLWLMLTSGVSPAITGAQAQSVIHCAEVFNMMQTKLNSSSYFLPAILLGFSHAEYLIP